MAVLRTICRRLSGSKVFWALTGSASLALRGVAVEPNDIDIQTDKAGAYEIEHRLSEYVAERVVWSTADRIRSYFGTLVIEGVKVHIAGDVETRLKNGTWERALSLNHQRHYVQIDDIEIPVLPLEYEHQMHLKLGKLHRAQMIKFILKGRHR